MTPRRTKIIATLGPSSASVGIIKQMILAGVNLVRVNFSHGDHHTQLGLISAARQAAQEANTEIGIIADLQGPKIRVGEFKKSVIELLVGQTFILDCTKTTPGDERGVGVDYQTLYQDVEVGSMLLLDDGLIELEVTNVKDKKIFCHVHTGGLLSNNKGINKKGGGLSANALTDKDMIDIQQAIAADVDYIAVSFTKNAHDIDFTKQTIAKAKGRAGVIAKIERQDALDHIEGIIKASDGVMVARGDLGVEIGLAKVPIEQKRIIGQARALNKAVITATQMMESMVKMPQATRAEVSDVANAVIDGTDAVMFSAETAVGKYPVRVIETVDEICQRAEHYPISIVSNHRIEAQFERRDEAIAMAVMYTANHSNIGAIVALTESGSTPIWMSRIRSRIPIYAFTRHISTVRRMTLYRGVYPKLFPVTDFNSEELEQEILQRLLFSTGISKGDEVIITMGSELGIEGGTDTMKLCLV